jgi:PAS domain S-box-containing protein
VFCLDEPPANYLLYLNHAEHLFNKAFTLYTGEFHRAVQKGDSATLALLQKGFASISPDEERTLRQKWMGTPLILSPFAHYLGYALLVGSLMGGLLLIWVLTLRRLVRQRTAQLEATLNAVPDLMFEVGLDGRYHDYHSPRTDLLAAPPDRLIGRLVSEVLPPAAAAICLSALREAEETGRSLGHQFELPLAQGNYWFELSVARKLATTGKEPRFIVLSRDISERKQAEAALLRRSEQLALMSAASQEINSELEIPIVLRQLVTAALKITAATTGAAARFCDGQMVFSEYHHAGRWMPMDYRFPSGYGVPGRVIQSRTFYLSNDAEDDPYMTPEIQQALASHNLLDMPIVSRHGELLGCFEIHNKPGGFDETDVQLLQGLAASAAVALENTALLAERRQAEQALRESETLKASVLAHAACGIVATDPDGLITVFNPGAETILGYRADEVVGQVTPLLFHDSDEIAALAAALSETLGYRVEAGLSVTVMDNLQGEITGYLGTLVDITEQKEAEASIKRLAHFDPLTGLPNRSLLAERVRHDLSRAQRGRESLALMFLDLDRFKNVNDSLGHRIGDEILVQLAKRLIGAVRAEDTISRLGGSLGFSSAKGRISCYPLFLTLLADPVLQELNGRLVAEGRMLALPVVKNLDVFKGGSLDLGRRRVVNTLQPLVLEAVEPALRRRIVPAVSFPAHRAGHAVRLELVLKGMAGILASPVGGVQQPRHRTLPEPRHGQRIGHPVCRHARLQRPANDFTIEPIEYDGQVQPTLVCPEVGDVRRPDRIGCRRVSSFPAFQK